MKYCKKLLAIHKNKDIIDNEYDRKGDQEENKMPIRINEQMPVVQKLSEENIFVMAEDRAQSQDIRQLKIAVVNIMPEKEHTELQLLRLLSNSPLQVEITFIRMDSHEHKNSSDNYLQKFYKSYSEIRHDYFDGMIITGAPVEKLEFAEVDYWNEITDIMEWSKTHVTSAMFICWAAQAGLYYHYGIEKYDFDKKLSGVFRHELLSNDEEIVRGFDDIFYAPHSRHTGVRTEELKKHPELKIMAQSDKAGAFLVLDKQNSRIFVTGHPEYDPNTLSKEYFRDIKKDAKTRVPENYFPDDDPMQTPRATWRSCANLLFSNWLNYYVYQITPYDLYKDKI